MGSNPWEEKMKLLVRITIVLCILCVLLVAEESNESLIMEKYGTAVVLLATYNEASGTIGQGSGFVVNESGVIVTNYHVIEGAYPIIVKFINGDIYRDILVVNLDKVRDIAIIKINGWNLPHVELGNSDSIKIGERVVVIGNPEGLSNTISGGLLGGIRTHPDGYKLHQIDASISQGSSGSPVFNSDGKVIGIACASITSGQNLNFSIP